MEKYLCKSRGSLGSLPDDGYDKKTLILETDKDCSITAEIDIDHWTGFHPFKIFDVTAGKKLSLYFLLALPPIGFDLNQVMM